MILFSTSLLCNHLKNIDTDTAMKAGEVYKKSFLSKIENIKSSKEKKYRVNEDVMITEGESMKKLILIILYIVACIFALFILGLIFDLNPL